MLSDIKAKRVTATGALSIGRARIKQIQVLVSNVGVGRLTISDGTGGPTILDLDFGSNDSYVTDIPENGILATLDPVVVTATNISAITLYYA